MVVALFMLDQLQHGITIQSKSIRKDVSKIQTLANILRRKMLPFILNVLLRSQSNSSGHMEFNMKGVQFDGYECGIE